MADNNHPPIKAQVQRVDGPGGPIYVTFGPFVSEEAAKSWRQASLMVLGKTGNSEAFGD